MSQPASFASTTSRPALPPPHPLTGQASAPRMVPPRTPERRIEGEHAAMEWIEAFAALAQDAIEEEHDELLRRRYEDELLRRARWLRATGLFEIMQIRHPGLRAMIEHEVR